MAQRLGESLKQILTAHHLTNIVLSLAFVVSKATPLLCKHMYNTCWFDTREHEVLVFLSVVVVWKNRKSANWLQYLSTFFVFSKMGSSFLFYRANPLYGLVYVVAALAAFILFPEPEFAESDKITYFHGEGLQRELERDRSVVWIIEFFTSWSQESRRLAPVFSSLSEKYTLPNLRFGKLDVGRHPKEAERFRINNHAMSKQLPSISIFKEGTQVDRRPAVGSNNRAIPFVFSEENCIMAFDMNNLFVECKSRLRRNKESGEGGKPHCE